MSRPLPATRGRLLLAFLLVVVLTVCAIPLANAAPDAVLLVDDFSTNQGPLVAFLNVPASSSVPGSGILGEERDILVTVTDDPVGDKSASAQVINHSLSHSQQSGVIANTLVQWDGRDGSPDLDRTGLGTVDLTQGNTQNGLEITVVANDRPTFVWFYVYTGTTRASQGRLTLPGGQSYGPGKLYYLPFASFGTRPGATAGADFHSVGAVEMWIDGYIDSTDLTIDTVRTGALDWGDLPDSSVGGPNYATRASASGPRHAIGNLYLGALIDGHELNGLPTVAADGDDKDNVDDEDGVSPTLGAPWNIASGGSVDVTVTGGSGCLSGWVDWTNNGNFTDAGDAILTNVLVTTGNSTHKFSVPVTPTGTLYARFRLYALDAAGGCTSTKLPTGQVVNGEVEDYRWSFTPNSVSLQSFSGSTAPAALPVVGMVLASAAALVAGLWKALRG